MCRLVAYPPGTSKDTAIEILNSFGMSNDDGVGSAYVKDSVFVLKKYTCSFKEAITKGMDLFDHMPYAGWTIAHVRLATEGDVSLKNTHPLEIHDTVMCHNGCWTPSEVLRDAVVPYVLKGETDSEVAGVFIERMGAQRFYNWKCSSGVYLQLNRKGELTVIKATGDLVSARYKGSFIMASELDPKYEALELCPGYVRFGADGLCIESWFREKDILVKVPVDAEGKELPGTRCPVYTNHELWKNHEREEW